MSGQVTRLGLLGFKPVQRQVIKSISSLSSARDISYAVIDDANVIDADLFIVDAEDPAIIEEWKRLGEANNPDRTLFIGDQSVDAATHQIRRSQLAGQLLNVLDEMSVVLARRSHHAVAGVIGRPRVLVVDDSLSVRTQMTICLEDFSVEITTAETAEEGIGIVGSEKVDLVFLDVMLPGMDGYEACRKLKDASVGGDLPVVLLTSKSSPFNKVRGVMAGCDRYLTKPAEIRDVNAVLTHFLGDTVCAAGGNTPAQAALSG